jgi:hypothetical protein
MRQQPGHETRSPGHTRPCRSSRFILRMSVPTPRTTNTRQSVNAMNIAPRWPIWEPSHASSLLHSVSENAVPQLTFSRPTGAGALTGRTLAGIEPRTNPPTRASAAMTNSTLHRAFIPVQHRRPRLVSDGKPRPPALNIGDRSTLQRTTTDPARAASRQTDTACGIPAASRHEGTCRRRRARSPSAKRSPKTDKCRRYPSGVVGRCWSQRVSLWDGDTAGEVRPVARGLPARVSRSAARRTVSGSTTASRHRPLAERA